MRSLGPATRFGVAGLRSVNWWFEVWRCDVGSILYPDGMHYHRVAARGATSRSWSLSARRSPGWLLAADARAVVAVRVVAAAEVPEEPAVSLAAVVGAEVQEAAVAAVRVVAVRVV